MTQAHSGFRLRPHDSRRERSAALSSYGDCVDLIANPLYRREEVRISRTERGAVDDEWRPDDDERRAAFRAFHGLRNGQTADGLHGDRNRGYDLVDLVERAEPADQAALVEADVMDDDVHAKTFPPLCAVHAIVGTEIVAHDLDPEIVPGLDDPPDRRLVRASHDD